MSTILCNLLVCLIGVLWLLAEIHLGLPGLKSPVGSTGFASAQQTSVLCIVLSMFLLPALVPPRGAVVLLLERLWPVSEMDDLSRTALILDHTSVDAETSLKLEELEQKRVLQHLSGHLGLVRR